MPEFIDISFIKENPDNPRFISDEQFEKLVESIKNFPKMLELRPIVVNKNMVVLGGNMRLKACQAAGLKQIPITIANLNEKQQQEFIVRDNLNYGDWDLPKLKDWDNEQLKDWGVDISQLKEIPDKVDRLFDPVPPQMIISCKNEREQKKIFEELEQRGFKCKLLT